MIAALIGVASGAALIQFVYYCRSAVASVQSIELSDHVLSVAGIRDQRLAADDFQRFFELVQLCPEQRSEKAGIGAVARYYKLLRILDQAFGKLMPAMSSWARREEQNCSHFAAVMLDRRISSSRDLFLHHATNRP